MKYLYEGSNPREEKKKKKVALPIQEEMKLHI